MWLTANYLRTAVECRAFAQEGVRPPCAACPRGGNHLRPGQGDQTRHGVDGLKGFPEAIETQHPKTQVQLCIVHLVRASLNYATWQDRKKVGADLKPIYKAMTVTEAIGN